ncbi:general amidase [Vararia minispora EC-137]|uniref:General amidase n=1 Tax=Vararia minispora EC-137 TaxID=1314806 RepID=A0ACB8QDA7_9AGAM|nr:general amidase [Vararia minispora EC-137]
MAAPVTWQELLAEKKQRQLDAIPKDWIVAVPSDDVLDVTDVPASCGLLTTKELGITEMTDIELLLRKLASGELSSVEVTVAYYKRAIIAQQVVSCLTEIFVDKALERAAWLDEQLKKTGKPVGPLHGLPVSLKDQVAIKGLETTIGYISWIGKYATRDATLTEILYDCGAVPFVRTNLPQTIMWPETYNLIFGRTLNPHNRKLTSGGSSGGEGALLGMKGSPLGVGTDLGGSVRIPASYNGVYGMRPSCNRLPYEGLVNTCEGQDSMPSVLGPMSHSIGGIKAFMKAVINSEPWLKDPLAIRKPWDEDEYKLKHHGAGGKLVFGFLWNDGAVLPHEPIQRAMKMTREALEAVGHEAVVDWVPYKHAELYKIMRAIGTAVGQADYNAVIQLTGEPLIESMDGNPNSYALVTHKGELSAFELWQVHKRRQVLRKEYLDQWQATATTTSTGRPVDAIISPTAPWAAPPHGKNTNADYTRVYNALDYVACVFPVTKVDPAIDKKPPPHQFFSERDESAYNLYDPEVFKNAPVCLQLVGRTLEEEAVIGMTEVVDRALKAHISRHSDTP